MKEYTVMPIGSSFVWDEIPRAQIDSYPWGQAYMPRTFAQLVLRPGDCFLLRMVCEECEPRAIYRNYNDPVYTDSCMEFFASYCDTDARYINMEMNANGTLLSCVGADRHSRVPLADLTGGQLPGVCAERHGGAWILHAQIPLSLLKQVYGISPDTFAPGFAFRGNFYKCGDKTDVAHYGMWNPVLTPTPDFHRPEFFGTLRIGGNAL